MGGEWILLTASLSNSWLETLTAAIRTSLKHRPGNGERERKKERKKEGRRTSGWEGERERREREGRRGTGKE